MLQHPIDHPPHAGTAGALARLHDNGRPSPAGVGDGIPVDRPLKAIRQHLGLVIAIATLVGTAAVLFTLRRPELYRAVATFRLVDARRGLASEGGEAPAVTDRTADPLLSVIQVLRSRRSIGAVVDSQGLRLVAIHRPFAFQGWLARAQGWRRALDDVRVSPDAPDDTLAFRFGAERFSVGAGPPLVEAPYGKRIRLRLREERVHPAGAHGGPHDRAAAQVSFVVPERPTITEGDAAVVSRDEAIDQVLENLKVTPRPSTDVVDVTYIGSDPELAQRLVNQLVQAFQTDAAKAAIARVRRQREFLGEQLRAAEGLLGVAEARLIRFQTRQPFASSLDQLASERAVVASLEARRGEAETDRRMYQRLLQRLESQTAAEKEEGWRAIAYAPEITSDRVLEHLNQQLLAYRAGLDSLRTGPWRRASTDPDVQQLSALVRKTQEEFVLALRARVASLGARTQALSELSASGSELMQSLPGNQLEEARLRRRVDALRATVDELRPEFEKARVMESVQVADIVILDLAPLPYRPTGVPVWALLLCGLVLGTIAGGGVAVLAESMNVRVRLPEELPESAGAPGLGVIPKLSPSHGWLSRVDGLVDRVLHGEANGCRALPWLAAAAPAGSVGLEAFRMLRMRLTIDAARGSRILVVTSAAPQEGKTLVAANLAATYAREGGKVLLVDGDVKRPRLHKLFRVPPAPGLVELLRADHPGTMQGYTFAPSVARGDLDGPLPAGLHRTAIDRLFLLPRGALSVAPVELLHQARVGAKLRQLARHFDVVIMDTPPVLVSADAASLAPLADGVILVVRAGRTHRDAAGLAYEHLTAAGARIIGAVLNDPGDVVTRYRKLYYSYETGAAAESSAAPES